MAGARSCRLRPRQTEDAEVAEGAKGAGMGERFTTALRPGCSQWAALEKALESCRTQPPACFLGLPAHPRLRNNGAQ